MLVSHGSISHVALFLDIDRKEKAFAAFHYNEDNIITSTTVKLKF